MSNRAVVDFSQSLDALKKALEEKRRPIQAGVFQWAGENTPQYPWHQPGKSPYEVFIGEWWLKESPPAVALCVYQPFIKRFISLQTLARTKDEELISFLSNFHLESFAECLKNSVENLLKAGNGKMPVDSGIFAKASGLKHHSVMAVMSFGCNMPVAVVDENALRMLARLFCQALPSPAVNGLVYALGESLLPQTEVQCYNCGLLDISELLCGEKIPLCSQCPLRAACDYARILVNTH